MGLVFRKHIDVVSSQEVMFSNVLGENHSHFRRTMSGAFVVKSYIFIFIISSTNILANIIFNGPEALKNPRQTSSLQECLVYQHSLSRMQQYQCINIR